MTTEIDKLNQAFDAEGHPLPSENSRDAAIAHAMEAFARENPSTTQGSTDPDRLTNTGTSVFKNFFRRRSMNLNLPNLKPMMIGGASLAVLSIAILNTQYVEQQKLKSPIDLDVRDIHAAPSTMNAEVIGLPGAASANGINTPTSEPSELVAGLRGNSDDAMLADLEIDSTVSSSRIVGGKDNAGRIAQEQYASRKKEDHRVAPLGDEGAGSGIEALMRSATEAAPAIALKSTESVAAYDAYSSSTVQERSARPPSAPAIAGGMIAAESQLARARQHQTPDDLANKQVYKDQGRDKFTDITPNPVRLVHEAPVSTFSIDVDTASYAFMRASLNNGVLPQKDAVRIEELINYFPYDYAAPQDKSEPFRAHVNVMPTPWNPETKLMHIGIKGYELPKTNKPHSNLVFLIDSSGSMNAANKLPLLRNSFKLLLSTLRGDDTIAIVTYAGSAGTVLEPTPVSDKNRIIAALDQLRSGGSTAGAEGIRQAYQLAEQNFNQSGVNRVILATDGDFNVGITDHEELKSFIERKRETGVSLSVLGFGKGNYNDELMQTLAQNGNGNAAYIDSLTEARKVLVEEAGATLFTIAKDVKIQIEFNPQTVSEYRLIGYETRLLNREDFNNDKIDAGDIGAGHTVTAIYEITPSGSAGRLVDDLRYQSPAKVTTESNAQEYAFLKLRYKLPDQHTSTLITTPVTHTAEVEKVGAAPREARHATAVAAFGQLLRGGRFTGSYSYDDVIELAISAKGDDRFGYRAEFINLVRLAKSAAGMESLQR